MTDQLSKLHESLNEFCSKVVETLDSTMNELRRKPAGESMHFTPQSIQTMNFLERKFVMTYLSYHSVIQQYIKSFAIIITLVE